MRLKDRVVLIIGAARGIGDGIAERFIEEGARIMLADRDASAGVETADRLGAHFVPANIAERADAERAVAATIERYGRSAVRAMWPMPCSFWRPTMRPTSPPEGADFRLNPP